MTKPSIDRIIRDSQAECLVLSRGEAKVIVDEVVRLREAISGVIVVANSGALKEFSGEPWLARVLATQL